MYLSHIDLQGIRNVSEASFDLSPGINIFFGENGSGKTSLLEAIYLLGRGRTFRTRHTNSLINHKIKKCTVVSSVIGDEGSVWGNSYTVGVSREVSGGFQFKVAGSRINSAASLSQAIPLLLMNKDSFQLLEGSPGVRRRFLDWGVFHVEQPFQSIWKQFQRVLQQRNSLLRRDRISRSELVPWDESFVTLSLQITEMRQRYFDQAQLIFQDFILKLTNIEGVKITFFEGWDTRQALSNLLKLGFEKDIARRTTLLGPHKANIRIYIGPRPAVEVLSRGQIKSLVTALILAQGHVLESLTKRRCAYLLDDLASELDSLHLERTAALLKDTQAQVFITGADRQPLEQAFLPLLDNEVALFHVEQGSVSPINYGLSKGEPFNE